MIDSRKLDHGWPESIKERFQGSAIVSYKFLSLCTICLRERAAQVVLRKFFVKVSLFKCSVQVAFSIRPAQVTLRKLLGANSLRKMRCDSVFAQEWKLLCAFERKLLCTSFLRKCPAQVALRKFFAQMSLRKGSAQEVLRKCSAQALCASISAQALRASYSCASLSVAVCEGSEQVASRALRGQTLRLR